MVGILMNGSLNLSWYQSKLHSFAVRFFFFFFNVCVFNSHVHLWTKQGTCAIEGTACIVLRIINAEQVLYGSVYKNVHGDVSNNTYNPSIAVITQGKCLKESWTRHMYNGLLSIYIWFYCCIHHLILRHLKREYDLYQNINHHSLYVNKFRISPFTMQTSTRAGNATFPELINHTHWVIWQSTPNTGWGAAIPRAQTHTI